jgi:DegV family protein with EDD domain
LQKYQNFGMIQNKIKEIFMKVAIVTDSNSGITQQEAKQLGITVIPMPFLIDGEEFFEDINLTQEGFYQKLTQDADVSTSQPNIFMVVEKWTKLLETYDEIVHIPMSSSLSATTETAINS